MPEDTNETYQIIWMFLKKNKNLIEYDVYFNLRFTVKKESSLISNGLHSIYTTKGNLKDKNNYSNEDNNYYIERKSGDTFIYSNLKDRKLITTEFLNEKAYKVHEELLPIDWKLIPKEKKVINDYEVFKAKGIFRGREYVAWYAPDIPMNIGPWKFRGLPGLILEITDSTKSFQWIATTITYPYYDTVIKEPVNKDMIALPLYDFIILKEKNIEENTKRKIASAPKGVTLISSTTQRGIELVYEWEEKKK
jgi:GLPGLI family protein